MRGRSIPLSRSQRLTVDLLRFSIGVPAFTERRLMNLSALAAARAQCPVRTRWMTLFLKAYAMVAEEIPRLRQVYLPFPWPHVYEYATSTGLVLVSRDHDGEQFQFGLTLRSPAALSLLDIDKRITHAVEGPTDQVKQFRRALSVARLPTPVRRCLLWLAYHLAPHRQRYFGTFAVTTHTVGRSSGLILPWNARLSYAPIERDGTMDVRLVVDHRIFDSPTPERALMRMEEVLNGPLVTELRAVTAAGQAEIRKFRG